MYVEEELLAEIRELLDDEKLFEAYERAFREYHYYFDTTNYIVLNVYPGSNDHGPGFHVPSGTTRRAFGKLAGRIPPGKVWGIPNRTGGKRLRGKTFSGGKPRFPIGGPLGGGLFSTEQYGDTMVTRG